MFFNSDGEFDKAFVAFTDKFVSRSEEVFNCDCEREGDTDASLFGEFVIVYRWGLLLKLRCPVLGATASNAEPRPLGRL